MTQTILLVGSFIGSTVDHQTKQETHWWTKVSISLDEDTGSLRLDGYGNSYYGTNKRMTFVLIGFAFNLMKPIKMAKIHFNESGQTCQPIFYDAIFDSVNGKISIEGDIASGLLRAYEFKPSPP